MLLVSVVGVLEHVLGRMFCDFLFNNWVDAFPFPDLSCNFVIQQFSSSASKFWHLKTSLASHVAYRMNGCAFVPFVLVIYIITSIVIDTAIYPNI